MSTGARFVHLSGGREGSIDLVAGDEALLGRDRSQCSVHADPAADPSISRVHARVWFDGQRWQIEDQHSANGIRVNGEVVSRAILQEGSIVELSREVKLRFELMEEQDTEATAAVMAAVRPSGGRDAIERTDEFPGAIPEFDTIPEASPAVAREIKMYRVLVACLAGVLVIGGGSWLAREAHLKSTRVALQARSAEAATLASNLIFSDNARSDWITETREFTEVGEDGAKVTVTETVEVIPKAKQGERLNAIDELLKAAIAEAEFSERTGDDLFTRGLSQDPFEAHVQQLLGELTGTPVNMRVPGAFMDEVKKKIRTKLAHPGKGRWSNRLAHCRLQGIRKELEGTLRDNVKKPKATSDPKLQAREQRVVRDLVYVAWVESKYQPEECSVAGARGMWQFIRSTGKRYGMTIDGRVDQRCDWRRATIAAAHYFDFLLNEFDGYPFLALAAYNAGERRVGRVLRDDSIPDHLKNFYGFTAAGVLPNETRKYVPSIVASAFIGDDYDRALESWNNSHPNRPLKRWKPCTEQEMQPPRSVNCSNPSLTACRDRR